jgi:hypothetical protein
MSRFSIKILIFNEIIFHDARFHPTVPAFIFGGQWPEEPQRANGAACAGSAGGFSGEAC